MGVIFGLTFIMITCFGMGYFIGYNKGFDECDNIHERYSLTTSKGISGKEYVEKYGECPICVDCPHNCPLEN